MNGIGCGKTIGGTDLSRAVHHFRRECYILLDNILKEEIIVGEYFYVLVA
jgi:hypothetical protein